AGGTSDIDEYFDSAPIPAAAFDEPVPTYSPAPAAPAKSTPAPASAPVPTTKPPFKDDGSL
ncbi:MAG TPA: protoheme IX synthesis protein, partial [Achromobacter sp.]|nr:protoheme IX synthesis protein [Achromobacter sp.]